MMDVPVQLWLIEQPGRHLQRLRREPWQLACQFWQVKESAIGFFAREQVTRHTPDPVR